MKARSLKRRIPEERWSKAEVLSVDVEALGYLVNGVTLRNPTAAHASEPPGPAANAEAQTGREYMPRGFRITKEMVQS